MTDILEPWYAVATRHEDIRKGRVEEAAQKRGKSALHSSVTLL